MNSFAKGTLQVGAVYRECSPDCDNPTSEATNWRYQRDYLGEEPPIAMTDFRQQMSYISTEEGSSEKTFTHHYYFDVSAGEDIPVYIVDSGAQLDHHVSIQGSKYYKVIVV